MTKKPKQINLTTDQAASLKQRLLAAKDISLQDKELLAGLVSFNLWLQEQLSLAKLSIRKLKQLFGFRREKKIPKIPMM
jgi:hypothetical protein